MVLRAGYSSFPGKSLDEQAEADRACGDPNECDVRYVTAGDIAFMNAVIHVNECLAKGYTRQYRDADATHPFGGPESIHGIGIDPGSYHRCEFNSSRERPTIGYPPEADLSVRNPAFAVSDPDPDKKVRIVGDVRMVDIAMIQDHVAIRADEGEPMTFREGIEWGGASPTPFTPSSPLRRMRSGRSGSAAGSSSRSGSSVHGGGRRTRAGGPAPEPTMIEDRVIVGKDSVVFRAHLAESTLIGAKAVIVGYDNGCDPEGNCTPGEVIPDRCVKFSALARSGAARPMARVSSRPRGRSSRKVLR